MRNNVTSSNRYVEVRKRKY